MQGLPLANPQQSGLLVQGFINQAFGNWLGTDMSLDLVIVSGVPPAGSSPVNPPKNLSLNWKKGQNASDAIKSTLSTAYPGMTVKVNLNGNLVAPEDSPGIYTGVQASPNISSRPANRSSTGRTTTVRRSPWTETRSPSPISRTRHRRQSPSTT